MDTRKTPRIAKRGFMALLIANGSFLPPGNRVGKAHTKKPVLSSLCGHDVTVSFVSVRASLFSTPFRAHFRSSILRADRGRSLVRSAGSAGFQPAALVFCRR